MRLNTPTNIRTRVPQSSMLNAIRALGLDPADVAELHLFPSHIVAKVFTRDDEGDLVTAADQPVTVDIHIALTTGQEA